MLTDLKSIQITFFGTITIVDQSPFGFDIVGRCCTYGTSHFKY